jgi:hypothetical protein
MLRRIVYVLVLFMQSASTFQAIVYSGLFYGTNEQWKGILGCVRAKVIDVYNVNLATFSSYQQTGSGTSHMLVVM